MSTFYVVLKCVFAFRILSLFMKRIKLVRDGDDVFYYKARHVIKGKYKIINYY